MAHYSFDDSALFKRIDETLANVDLKYLEQSRKEMLKEGKDVSILDKAIAERKRRDKLKLKNEMKEAKRVRKAAFLGLMNGLFGPAIEKDDMMPWEKDAMENDDYESYNFEEEELEEDDYYFDDDE